MVKQEGVRRHVQCSAEGRLLEDARARTLGPMERGQNRQGQRRRRGGKAQAAIGQGHADLGQHLAGPITHRCEYGRRVSTCDLSARAGKRPAALSRQHRLDPVEAGEREGALSRSSVIDLQPVRPLSRRIRTGNIVVGRRAVRCDIGAAEASPRWSRILAVGRSRRVPPPWPGAPGPDRSRKGEPKSNRAGVVVRSPPSP